MILFLAIFFAYESFACTSAIVSPALSRDGGAILWKHRDNTTHDTCVEYITGGKYAYTALVNCFYGQRRGVYAGLNEAGFGVMSTATRNLYVKRELTATEESQQPQFVHSVAVLGLKSCATVDEFENALKNFPRKHGFQTNLGVGDSTGCAAYFEIWETGYRRYDVKDGSFDIRTNFSFAGDPKKFGKSKRRYDLMQQLMGDHKGTFTALDFINYSRSYKSIQYGDILKDPHKYASDNHCVARRTSVASIVIVLGRNPHMLIINANPVTGATVPVWVAQKNKFPKCLRPFSEQHKLSRIATKMLYTRKSKDAYLLNKPLARAINRITPPDFDEKEMPRDIDAFNAMVDKEVDAYLSKLRTIL